MRWFSNGPKQCDQHCADGDKCGAYEGVFGKRFAQDQGSKNGIKDEAGLSQVNSAQSSSKGETDCLKGRENRQWKGGDLDSTPDDVRDDEHQHAHLETSGLHPDKLEYLPTCHRRRLYGGLWRSYGYFSSSRICDLRCRVSPMACRLVEITPTITPI